MLTTSSVCSRLQARTPAPSCAARVCHPAGRRQPCRRPHIVPPAAASPSDFNDRSKPEVPSDMAPGLQDQQVGHPTSLGSANTCTLPHLPARPTSQPLPDPAAHAHSPISSHHHVSHTPFFLLPPHARDRPPARTHRPASWKVARQTSGPPPATWSPRTPTQMPSTRPSSPRFPAGRAPAAVVQARRRHSSGPPSQVRT